MVFPGISGYRGDLEDVLNLCFSAFDLMEPKALEKMRWVEVRLLSPDAGTWWRRFIRGSRRSQRSNKDQKLLTPSETNLGTYWDNMFTVIDF